MPESTPEEQPATGRQRLRLALTTASRGQLVVALLLVVVGFAGVTQVRSNDIDDTYASYREQDLIDVLNGLAGTTQRAEAEIARLESTRRDLQSSTDARRAALAQAQERSDTLSILAGLVPVTGPGIRVTIEEVTGPVDIDTLLDTLQELRAAGAEAMQLNGKVRIIAQSALEDGVGGIYIDGTLLSAPYVLDVIGEPHTLAGAITFLQGPRSQFQEDGQSVDIDELSSLDIESVREAEQPVVAQPDPGQ